MWNAKDDIDKLEEVFGIYPQLSKETIENLWEDFSASYSASFLIVGDETVRQFAAWLHRIACEFADWHLVRENAGL